MHSMISNVVVASNCDVDFNSEMMWISIVMSISFRICVRFQFRFHLNIFLRDTDFNFDVTSISILICCRLQASSTMDVSMCTKLWHFFSCFFEWQVRE
jgi:hypothetical protein